MPNAEAVLDYREPEWVAEKLGLDKNTVYKYLQEGALPGVQLGRKWLVSERLLAEHLERETRRQTQLRASGSPALEPKPRRAGRHMPKTPRLNRSLEAASNLARREGAGGVNTVHLVLALWKVEGGMASTVLRNLGVTGAKLRDIYQPPTAVPSSPSDADPALADPAASSPAGFIPPTDDARRSLTVSLEQATELGHEYLGGEHVLLGILADADNPGAQLLATLGVTYDTARAELMKHIRPGD